MLRPLVIATIVFSFSNLAAAPSSMASGRSRTPNEATQPTLSAGEHFERGVAAMEAQQWDAAISHLQTVRWGYPDCEHAGDALYRLALIRYQIGELHQANELFTAYLKHEQSPANFEQVIRYKFAIAEAYRSGMKKRMLGNNNLPRLQSGRHDALDLYDEVAIAMPSHELAAQALFAKGNLVQQMGDYSGAVDRFQALIERFPRHPLAPESYLAISQAYLEESRVQSHNPDLLPLAQINVRKFRQDFPTDDRLVEAEVTLERTKEVFASGLFETGRFYERTKKYQSAAVYYSSIMRDFPGTQAAAECEGRLHSLPERGVG